MKYSLRAARAQQGFFVGNAQTVNAERYLERSTVVIPTLERNKADTLELLRSLVNQIEKPEEIVVVADRYYEIPVEISDSLRNEGVELLFKVSCAPHSAAQQRNLGARIAESRYVFFLDDDVIPRGDWFHELKTCLKQGIEIVGGASRPLLREGAKRPSWWDDVLLGPYVAIANEHMKNWKNAIWTCNMAVKKTALEEMGYFDEKLGPPMKLGEDTEFVWRAVSYGKKMLFTPRAVVFHRLRAERLSMMYLRKRAIMEGMALRAIGDARELHATLLCMRDLTLKTARAFSLLLTLRTRPTAFLVYFIVLLNEMRGYALSESQGQAILRER